MQATFGIHWNKQVSSLSRRRSRLQWRPACYKKLASVGQENWMQWLNRSHGEGWQQQDCTSTAFNPIETMSDVFTRVRLICTIGQHVRHTALIILIQETSLRLSISTSAMQTKRIMPSCVHGSESEYPGPKASAKSASSSSNKAKSLCDVGAYKQLWWQSTVFSWPSLLL